MSLLQIWKLFIVKQNVSLTHTHTLSLSLTHTHTHTLSLSLTHSLSHPHAHAHMHTHTHTHTPSHIYTHTHTHMYFQILHFCPRSAGRVNFHASMVKSVWGNSFCVTGTLTAMTRVTRTPTGVVSSEQVAGTCLTCIYMLTYLRTYVCILYVHTYMQL